MPFCFQVSVGSCGSIAKELAKQALAEPANSKASAKGKPKKGNEKEVSRIIIIIKLELIKKITNKY